MQVGVYQESAVSLLSTTSVDVITKYVVEGLMTVILYEDDLVFISESQENLREVFDVKRDV